MNQDPIENLEFRPANIVEMDVHETGETIDRTPVKAKKEGLRLTVWTAAAAILVLVFISLVGFILIKTQSKDSAKASDRTAQDKLPFSAVGIDQLNLGQLGQLDINGSLRINGGLVITPSIAPGDPLSGQLYFNQDSKQIAYYDGTTFQNLSTAANSVASIGGISGSITLGQGLSLQGNVLSAQTLNSTQTSAVVTSLQGQSGAVILVGGNGVNVSGTTITNSGVTGVNSATGTIQTGRGLTTSGNTLLSTVSLASASGTLLVVDDGNGNYTITQVGAGASGSVALGPAVAQTDASNFPSLDINKTGSGDLIQFSVGGVDRFIVNQSGAITTGSIAFSQLTGTPQIVNNFTDGGSNTATGAITLGAGLALSGNTILNTASGGISAVNGTANQVISSTSLGVVTLSLPQDINTNSSPSFSGLTLTGLGSGIVQSTAGVLSSGAADRNSGTLFTNSLSVVSGGTGANNAGTARTNLGAAASGGNSDITSLSGLTTALSASQGGTGATTLATNGVLIGNGVGAISSVVAGSPGLCLTSSAGTPTWSACPGSGGVSSVNTFTGAVSIQGTANQVNVANAAGTITLSLPQNINTASSPQFSGLTLTGNLSVQGGSSTLGTAAQAGSLIINDGSSNTGTFQTAALGQNTIYTLPDPGLASVSICLTSGNCAGAGSGVTTAGGTNGAIALFTGSNNIEESTLTQSGSTVTASGNVIIQGSNSLALGTASTNAGSIAFYNAAGGNTVSLQAPNANPASNFVLRLPSADGSGGNCLTTDGLGSLSFAACLSGSGGGSGGVVSLNGLSGSLTLANASGSGSTVTINDATTGAKGIASFNATDFTVTTGAVSIANDAITSAKIANATITGTDIASATVGNSNLVNSSVTVSAGTGLTGGGSVALGASTTLNVSYGSGVGTAVQGNTTLVCSSGTGNLSGGGNTITLGGGGTCGALSTIANPTFATSVTSAQLIMTGAGSNGTLQVANLGQATAYTLPDPGAASATICLSTGNCAGSGTGVTTAGGTTNRLAKFTGSQAIGDSTISDNGTLVSIGADLNVTGAVTLTTALSVANGGTNATTAAGARSNLGAAASGANSDITSLSGLTTALSVGQGGTGATTLTANGVLFGNGSGAIAATAVGTTGQCLVATTGNPPTWGSCAGSGSGATLQAAYGNSTGGTTPEIKLDATRTGLDIQDADTTIGANENLLTVRASNGSGLGVRLFSVDGDGQAVFQNSANSTTAFQIQNAAGTSLLNVDTTNTNLISNSNFEVDTTGWTNIGSATSSRVTTSSYIGGAALNVVTTTADDEGVKYTVPTTLSASTTYTISWYTKRNGGGSFNNMMAAFSYDGTATSNCTGINTQTTIDDHWRRHYCQFITGSGGTAPNASNAVIIKHDTAGLIANFFLDGVQLEQSGSVTPFNKETKVIINPQTQLASPLTIQPAVDSQSVLQVLSATDGNTVLNVDSIGRKLTLYTEPGVNSYERIELGAPGGAPGLSFYNTNNSNRANITSSSGNLQFCTSTTISCSNQSLILSNTGAATFQNETNSQAAFQLQNATSGANGNLFLASTNTANLVTNPSFEADNSGWTNSAAGTATVARNTTEKLYGNASGAVTTSATTSSGIKTSVSTILSPSTSYSLSFWAKAASGSFTMEAGYSINGGAETACTLRDYTATASGFTNTIWRRSYCTFSLGATAITNSYVYIRQSDNTVRTFYLDGIQLEPNSSFYHYAEGNLQLNGVITTPTVFRAQQDTFTAFQIQSTLGNPLFTANTQNNRIGIGGGAFTAPLATLHVAADASVELFRVTDSTTGGIGSIDVFNIADEGVTTFRNRTNSNSAFRIQNADASATIFKVDTSTGRIGINTNASAPSADLTFGEGAARTINVLTRTTNAAGSDLTISAGAAGSGASAFAGGVLTLQGGAAGGTGNANGGGVTIAGGAGVGTGVQGEVSIGLSATSATERLCSTHAATAGTTAGTYIIRDCSGTPGDYAEDYGTADASIEAGDVVAVDASRPAEEYVDDDGHKGSKAWIQKATGGYQSGLVGIISTQPSDRIGRVFTPEENPRPVALSGRVPVKVTNENGAIVPGDRLTSSANHPGRAMKATAPGQTIGLALSGFDGTSGNACGSDNCGSVIVMVNLSNYVPPVGPSLQGGEGMFTNLNVTGNLSTLNLVVVGNALVRGNIVIEGHLLVGEDSAGTVTIPTGQTSLSVNFTHPYAKIPHITTSASDFVAVRVENKTVNGFVLRLVGPQAGDIYVDWIAAGSP